MQCNKLDHLSIVIDAAPRYLEIMYWRINLIVAITVLVLATSPVSAADPQIFEPPTTPTAPPALNKHAPKDVFTCARYYSYRGKVLSCDSQLHWDGEGLRPVIQGVPSAVTELNSYQGTRRGLQTSAYIGSFGMLLFVQGLIAGGIIGNIIFPYSGQVTKNIVRVSGISLAVGSVAYGFTVLHYNERHLDNAVHFYNDVHPDNPIELNVSAGF